MRERQNLPKITISATDLERLSRLAEGARRNHPDIADYLLRELDRANVAENDGGSAQIHMGSQVEYRDEHTGQVRSIQLVYPSEADPSHGRVSVLTPIGAALIGLSEGQSIEWKARGNAPRRLRVLKVGALDFASP